mmetsp:Transcript_5163/g.11498  ORF Transcript_5163/g.11498 Transcript_5163/m.11498 type:complete len:90 (+) Transcript_5163:107-376(+)
MQKIKLSSPQDKFQDIFVCAVETAAYRQNLDRQLLKRLRSKSSLNFLCISLTPSNHSNVTSTDESISASFAALIRKRPPSLSLVSGRYH